MSRMASFTHSMIGRMGKTCISYIYTDIYIPSNDDYSFCFMSRPYSLIKTSAQVAPVT